MDAVLSEETLHHFVELLARLVEAAGALVVFAGAVVGFVRLGWASVVKRGTASFIPIRLDVGRFLVLGLEFQLAADVLKTATTPTFGQLGHLAAVAAVRTVLTYFLDREIRREKEELKSRGEPQDPT